MKLLALLWMMLLAAPGIARGGERERLDSSIQVVDLELTGEDKENQSPFQVNLSVDLPVIVTGVVLTNAPVLMGIHIHRNMQNLDPGGLNPIDRVVLGNWDKNADAASDVLVGAAVGSAIGLVIPYLHTRGVDGVSMPDNLMVLPMVFEGGFGAVATLLY